MSLLHLHLFMSSKSGSVVHHFAIILQRLLSFWSSCTAFWKCMVLISWARTPVLADVYVIIMKQRYIGSIEFFWCMAVRISASAVMHLLMTTYFTSSLSVPVRESEIDMLQQQDE